MSTKDIKRKLEKIQDQFIKANNMLNQFNKDYIDEDRGISINCVDGDGIILVDDYDNSEILDMDEIANVILGWESDK